MSDTITALDTDFLDHLRQVIEHDDVILEHRHYRGGRAPTKLVFSDFDELRDYIREHGRYGDRFYVWRFAAVCTDDNFDRRAIVADERGEFPESGPY